MGYIIFDQNLKVVGMCKFNSLENLSCIENSQWDKVAMNDEFTRIKASKLSLSDGGTVLQSTSIPTEVKQPL